jgi:hypothetical protein
VTQIGMESPIRRFRPKTSRKRARKIRDMVVVVVVVAAGFVQTRFVSISTTRIRSTKPKPLLG